LLRVIQQCLFGECGFMRWRDGQRSGRQILRTLPRGPYCAWFLAESAQSRSQSTMDTRLRRQGTKTLMPLHLQDVEMCIVVAHQGDGPEGHLRPVATLPA
jgi:hypothetical protein